MPSWHDIINGLQYKKPYPQPVIQSNTNESNQIQLVGLRVEHTVEFIRGGSYPNPLFASIQCCPIIMPRTNKHKQTTPTYFLVWKWRMENDTNHRMPNFISHPGITAWWEPTAMAMARMMLVPLLTNRPFFLLMRWVTMYCRQSKRVYQCIVSMYRINISISISFQWWFLHEITYRHLLVFAFEDILFSTLRRNDMTWYRYVYDRIGYIYIYSSIVDACLVYVYPCQLSCLVMWMWMYILWCDAMPSSDENNGSIIRTHMFDTLFC